jgi:hypothetical protein
MSSRPNIRRRGSAMGLPGVDMDYGWRDLNSAVPDRVSAIGSADCLPCIGLALIELPSLG